MINDKDLDKEKRKLEDLLELLGSIKGRHTELVTVLVPSGYNLNAITRQLESEKSTASNIKSTATRKNVIAALDMIIREIKNMKQTPVNGMALFCGNISRREGDSDIQLWVHEPPKVLKTKIYRCDQEFVLEPLREMVGIEEVFGLLVIDRQHATIGLLEGNNIKVLQKLSSGVPGKIKAGGQCLSPDTLVESKKGKKKIEEVKVGEEILAFDLQKNKTIYTKCINKWKTKKRGIKEIQVGEDFNKLIIIKSSLDHTFFVNDGNKIVEMLAKEINPLSGYLLICEDNKVSEKDIFDVFDYDKEMEMIDIETEVGNFFANEILVHNSSQRFHRITEGLAKEFFRRVSDEMKKIFFDMPRLKGILVGGPIPTKEEFLDEGNLVTKLKEKIISIKDIGYVDEHGLELLVEDSYGEIAEQGLIKEKKAVERFFEALGKGKPAVYGEEKVRLALERGAVEVLMMSKNWDRDKEKELEQMAENISAEVIIIDKNHADGEQFFNLTKGVAALLRFGLE